MMRRQVEQHVRLLEKALRIRNRDDHPSPGLQHFQGFSQKSGRLRQMLQNLEQADGVEGRTGGLL